VRTRFYSVEDWREVGISNPALRFFHERWRELLDYRTPISHRAPAMSALALLEELDRAEVEYRAIGHGKSGVIAIEQEAFGVTVKSYPKVEGTVTGDALVLELVGDLLEQRKVVAKHFLSGNSPDEITVSRSTISTQLMIKRLEKRYLPALTAGLRRLIFDEPHSSEGIKEIDLLATALAAELLTRGFAQSFLRTHTQMLELRDEESRAVLDRFVRFCARFDRPAELITVVFRVQGKANFWEAWSEDVANVVPELPQGAEQSPEWEEFAEQAGGVRFISFTIKSLDHHAASRMAYEELQRLADLAFVSWAGQEPTILAAATVRSRPRRAVVASGHQMQLQQVPVPLPRRAREVDQHQIESALESASVKDASKRRLAGALRYYRISIGQSWLESSFTNLWTALEVIASTDYGGNIIERVVRSVVPILASKKVKSMTDDLLGYLLRIGAHKSEEFRAIIPEAFNGLWLEPHLLLGALADQDNASAVSALYKSESPLIARRVEHFHEAVVSGNRLAGRVYQVARRIEWQIRRLYRLRNSIVHGAGITLNSEGLLTHLQSYVYETIVAQGRLLAGNPGLCNLEDVVAAADKAFHSWIAWTQPKNAQNIKDLDTTAWDRLYRPPYEWLIRK
jgi:hypothetical protein